MWLDPAPVIASLFNGETTVEREIIEQLKDRDLSIDAVLPSIIDTPQDRADAFSANFSGWARPDSIAAVVAFLLSSHAAAITGALIPVSGRF